MFRRGLLVLLSILLTLGFFVSSRAAPAEQSTVFPITVIVQKSANVRAGPGTDYAIIGSARPGQTLGVIGCNADCSWYQLAPDCWIAAFLVTPAQPIVPPLVIGNVLIPTIVVSSTILIPGATVQTTQCPQTIAQVNTYAGPGTFYPVVDTRPAGECVAVIGRNFIGDWFQLSKGMWIAASVIIYAEPIETMPITEPTATPTATPLPTNTPLPGSQPPTPTPQLIPPSSTSGQGCDPNYSGACVPLSSSDLNCPDIPATNFRSIGNDPHDLDGDKNGLACEQ